MSKHTPGPWNLYPNNASDWVVRKMFPDGQESHEIARCQSGMDNARLIAAAPDLLNELRKMYRAYVRLLENGRDRIVMLGGDCDAVDKMEADDPNLREARAAIAKAVGEES